MKASGWLAALVIAGTGLGGCGGGGNGNARDDEPKPKRTQTDEQRAERDGSGERSGDENAPGSQEFVTLYDRIGGERGVNALVDDWVARVLADPRVNFERRGTDKTWRANPQNVARLKAHFVQFINVTTGGPPQYSGRRMDEVHKGMEITNVEFDAMMDDLRASLTKVGVPQRDQRELMRKIELTREQIVEKR